MKNDKYHYSECGLGNVYLVNGYNIIETERGKAVSINDVDGLHKAIGKFLVFSKKDLSGDEIRFLRHEMLMSQDLLAKLLGVSEQSIRRWENGKCNIPKPSESLLRMLYQEKISNQHGKVSTILKKIANLEDEINDKQMLFKDTLSGGWQASA